MWFGSWLMTWAGARWASWMQFGRPWGRFKGHRFDEHPLNQWIPLHLHFLADLRLANWFPFPSWIPSNKLSPAGHWSLVVLPEPPRTLSGRVGPWPDRHTQLGSLRSGGPRLSTGREDDAVGRWSFSGNHGIWRDTMGYDTMEYNSNNNDNNYSNNNDNNNNDNTHNSNIYYI